MSANCPDAAEAADVLRQVELAREAAGARRPMPGWFGPARGILFTLFTGMAFGPWARADGGAWVAAGLLAAVAFLAVHVVVVKRAGIVVWPPHGSLRARTLAQLLPIGGYGVGWTAAVPFGYAGGALASAVTGGITLWILTAQQNATATVSRPGRTR